MLRSVREDIQAECIRTIERKVVDDSYRFSRRHRWKPLAFDVHGDDAVVLVATRGKRTGGGITAHLYCRREGGWVPMGSGGGGGGGENRTLPLRPAPGERWFLPASNGMSLDSETTGLLRSKHVCYLAFQVAEGVSHAQWRGHRRAVPDHGFVCVVWRGRSMPTVELFGLDGGRVDELGREELRSPVRRLPWHARVRYLVFHRFRRRGEWFNYAHRRR